MIQTIKNLFLRAGNAADGITPVWADANIPHERIGDHFAVYRFDQYPDRLQRRIRSAKIQVQAPDRIEFELSAVAADTKYGFEINGRTYSTEHTAGDTVSDVYQRIEAQLGAPLTATEVGGKLRVDASQPGDVLFWRVFPADEWEAPVPLDVHTVEARVRLYSAIVTVNLYALSPDAAGEDAEALKTQLYASSKLDEQASIFSVGRTINVSDVAGPNHQSRAQFEIEVRVTDTAEAEIITTVDTVATNIQGREPDNTFTA